MNKYLLGVFVLVVLGGAAFFAYENYYPQSRAVSDYSKPVNNPTPTPPTLSPQPIPTPTTNINTPTTPAGGTTKTYTNTQYGFSIQYPSIFTQPEGNDPNYSEFFDSTDGGTVAFAREYSFPPDTGSGLEIYGKFAVTVTNNQINVAHCLIAPPSTETSTSHIGTTTIHGVAFFGFQRDDAFAGGSDTTLHLRALHRGFCFDISSNTTYSGGVAGSVDTTKYDSQLTTWFSNMTQSFTFQ